MICLGGLVKLNKIAICSILSASLVLFIFFQNCAKTSFSELASSSELKPLCSGSLLSDLYQASVESYVELTDNIAKACVDSATDYAANTNFLQSDVGMATRFQSTCATRWCSGKLADTEAVGVVKSSLAWSGGRLNLSSALQIECRHNNKTVLSTDRFCRVEINRKKPIESFFNNYSSPTKCGSNAAEVSTNWVMGINSLISCATQYCISKDETFRWGLLSEISPAGYLIRCSRANF